MLINKLRHFKILSYILTLSHLFIYNPTLAQNDTQRTQLKSELQSIFYTIENNYGPLEFKQKQGIINWKNLKQNTAKKLEQVADTKDYYFLLAEFLYSLNDAHVSIALPTNFAKRLPLQFASANNNRAILNYIDKVNLAKANPSCKLNIGDVLVGINGLSLDEAHKKSLEFNAQGNPITNRSYFLLSLGNLQEYKGIDLSSPGAFFGGDTIQLSLLNAGSKDKKNCTLTYITSGTSFVSRKIPTEKEEMNMWMKTQTKAMQSAQNISGKNGANVSGKTTSDQRYQVLLKNYYRLMKISGYTGAAIEHLLDPSLQAEMSVGENSDNYYFPGSNNSRFQGQSRGDNDNSRENIKSSNGTKIALGHATPLWPIANFKKVRGARFITADNLYAGIIEQGSKKIGYIRIPSYMPKNIMFAHYGVRKIVAEMEEKTDYLIIDQFNNPGGAVVYSDMIIKSLVGKFDYNSHMTFALKPTQNFIRTYVEIYDELKKLASEKIAKTTDKKRGATSNSDRDNNLLKEISKQATKIKSCYQSNQSLCFGQSLLPLTELFEMSVDSVVFNNPAFRAIAKLNFGSESLADTIYTKPIYMLINELDFSGGDATPANLQDYKRVTLIGVRTAGAGGTVEEIENRVANQFSYRLTTSLMVRKNGSFVENLGVLPNVKFVINENDIKTNYRNTFSRISKLTDSLYRNRR